LSEEIPTCEPTEIVAGDTVRWTKDLASYPPADGWVLHYRILCAAFNKEISDIGASGVFDVTFAPTDTAAAVADTQARLIGWVVNGSSETHTIFDGWVQVLANLRTATATSARSHAEKMLAAIEAVLEGRATTDIEAYTIGGRSVTKMKADELTKWRGLYAGIVWRQRNRGVSSPSHQVRFV
jgi:hypothetical protein